VDRRCEGFFEVIGNTAQANYSKVNWIMKDFIITLLYSLTTFPGLYFVYPYNNEDAQESSVPVLSKTNNSASVTSKTYTGTINNKYDVVFYLENKEDTISGYYFYQKQGVDIPLKGQLSRNTITLYEVDSRNSKLAVIKGTISGNTITGTWEHLQTKKAYTIHLAETDKTIPVLPTQVEGTYKNAVSTKCLFTLRIDKRNDAYFYTIQTAKQSFKGKVSFYRSLDEQANFIKLEGIPWAEYEGAIDGEQAIKAKKAKAPIGIEGLLSQDEISIQNYGNAMNYYVKFADCGDKFIHLRK
jgi:hypothetical protein